MILFFEVFHPRSRILKVILSLELRIIDEQIWLVVVVIFFSVQQIK